MDNQVGKWVQEANGLNANQTNLATYGAGSTTRFQNRATKIPCPSAGDYSYVDTERFDLRPGGDQVIPLVKLGLNFVRDRSPFLEGREVGLSQQAAASGGVHAKGAGRLLGLRVVERNLGGTDVFDLDEAGLQRVIGDDLDLSLIHISEPTRLLSISFAV